MFTTEHTILTEYINRLTFEYIKQHASSIREDR